MEITAFSTLSTGSEQEIRGFCVHYLPYLPSSFKDLWVTPDSHFPFLCPPLISKFISLGMSDRLKLNLWVILQCGWDKACGGHTPILLMVNSDAFPCSWSLCYSLLLTVILLTHCHEREVISWCILEGCLELVTCAINFWLG